MGRPIKAIRWTCDHAGSEFGADSKTISARLRQAGTAAGADGKFSTRQIALAVFGDIDGERPERNGTKRTSWRSKRSA